MKQFSLLVLFLVFPVLAGWLQVEKGVEYRRFSLKNADEKKGKLHIIRFDPVYWELDFYQAGSSDSTLTARQWAQKKDLKAVVNAGMFGTNYTTHIGYAHGGGEVKGEGKRRRSINNSRFNKYESIAVYGPLQSNQDKKHFWIFDKDDPNVNVDSLKKHYQMVVQNLRLIKAPGENRWPQQKRRWSEAALGCDREGRILFLFSRLPMTMHEFNNHLLSLNMGIVSAQHLEGGPEAQLFSNFPKLQIELFGSFETGFNENDNISQAWPIPNVFGIRARKPRNSREIP